MRRPDVDVMLDSLSAQQLMRWLAFFAVRKEKEDEARRNAAEGYDDDEVTYW